MVLCKFFQQGSCRFGSKCNNEHFDVKQVIKIDVEGAINGKQWPLSTYGPFKDKPSIPNFIDDQSFEEIRMLCYEAKQKNFFDQFHQQFTKEALEANNKMKALLQMTPEIIDVAINVYDTPSDTSSSGVTAEKTINNNTNNPFGMSNPTATNSNSIFAKPDNSSSNIFGNNSAGTAAFGATNATGNSIFGGGTTNVQTTSIFGNSSAFGQQQPSIFGQTTKTANSIFGGSTGNSQQKPLFGQQQPQPTAMGGNLFASSAQQQQQQTSSGYGLFSQQNQQPQQQSSSIFGQQMPQTQNSNIFSQNTHPFGQSPQASQPQQGLFAQNVQTIQQPQQQGLFAQASQQAVGQGQLPATGQNLFAAQTTQQSQNVFGQAVQQQQQVNSNIYQQNQPNAGQQQQQQQIQSSSGLFQQQQEIQQTHPSGQNNSTLYSRMEDLTPDEIEAFKADCFLPGKIPFNPPPRELIN